MNRIFRFLTLAALSTLTLSACSSGTKEGDTNVEKGSAKKMEENAPEPAANADSLASGLARDTTHRPTGKEQFDNAAKSRDRDHDGLADDPNQPK
jgi:hypothetical protein